MQVVPFYDLLDNYQIPGMSRNRPGMPGIHVYQEHCLYYNVYQVEIKMSGHHSRYRDNYKGQVYHTGCQVIA